MSDQPSSTLTTDTRTEEERKAAYKEAAVELSKGIALGLVPYLGQAIDAYDTIESAITLYNAKKSDDQENAQFDLVLALVGWVPGPGDGIKKSLRLVNKDPQRFAPVLFDLLRFVLQECGIKTSPEALLDAVFDAAKLKAQITEVKQGVEDASAFKSLPQWMQVAVSDTLNMAQQNMPRMVGVVQKRLTKWKKLQHNSSAAEPVHGKAKSGLPAAKSADTAKQGQDRGARGHANTVVNSQVATQSLTELTNELVGISGEHIADYICAYRFGWGKDWKGHDDGAQGRWTEGTPNKTKLGKLSKGGTPKARHVLYKLSDGANGTGIDAVWRADPTTNKNKPYAVVEAKASRDEDAPKFLRKINNTRKPSITSTLGVNAISDPSELIEPIEGDAKESTATRTASKGRAQKGAAAKGSSSAKKTPPPQNRMREVFVQMSPEWIQENVKKAVGASLAVFILKKLPGDEKNYSRHLFYAPQYHLSGSPKAHFIAKKRGLPDTDHATHDAFHYDDDQVKKAVNKRKVSLREKYGNLPSLKAEK